ncbi:ABC transporter substrate-binding protein [Corynebacterium sp. H127]|uniref:ABC transporter substrate-binding protein n=1 Tax=Corynebacterium sp. H127 TaxID=3133418 RepID=UPI0030A43C17
MMNRRSFLAAAAVSVLLLTGCSKADVEQTGPGAERIAALGLGDVDTLLALGVTPVAVAPFSAPDAVSKNGLEPWAEKLGEGKEMTPIFNTSKGFTAGVLEEVTATNPSQIIAVNQAVDPQAKEALEKIAPTTLKPEGFADWQIPWKDQVEQIAGAVDKEKEGEKLIKDTEAAFEEYKKSHPELQGKKAAVVMSYSGKLGLYTDADGRGQFIESMGMEIPDGVQGTDKSQFYLDIAPENYSILEQVDVLYVLDYEGSAEPLKTDPAFAALLPKAKFIEQSVGNAMSVPNPVSIPWALEKLK